MNGEVTVYLTLTFVLFVSLILALVESASVQMAKNYRRADMNRALECVFAEYQKELLENYDVFAIECGYETGTYTEQNILDRLSYYWISFPAKYPSGRLNVLPALGYSSGCFVTRLSFRSSITAWIFSFSPF